MTYSVLVYKDIFGRTKAYQLGDFYLVKIFNGKSRTNNYTWAIAKDKDGADIIESVENFRRGKIRLKALYRKANNISLF